MVTLCDKYSSKHNRTQDFGSGVGWGGGGGEAQWDPKLKIKCSEKHMKIPRKNNRFQCEASISLKTIQQKKNKQ